MNLDQVRDLIPAIPDFPQPGIIFRDIFPVFRNPHAVATLIDAFIERLAAASITDVDVVVGLDARGFLIGPMIAARLNASFVPVRKKGKLPGDVIQQEYMKEYGADYFEIQSDSIANGQKVIIVDDLLATGGSASAAQQLVTKSGGEVRAFAFIIELPDLNGSKKLLSSVPVISLFSF